MAEGELVEIDYARRVVLDSLSQLSVETVALDTALGRVLAEEIVAGHPLPSFDNSAMDGFAVRAADLLRAGPAVPAQLRVIGESSAGHPPTATVHGGEAVAISSGAMLPEGADAVVRAEHTRTHNGVIEVLDSVARGIDIRRAGEDVQNGATVLERGVPLGPAQLGMLAALGHARARCTRVPRVSVLVTGDELLAADERPRPGAVRDSNAHIIAALARCAGAELAHQGRARDDATSTQRAIAAALEPCDALVICGGLSSGAHDYVRPSLRALGAEELFWGLAMQPGRQTWFGVIDGRPVFGLPGNPVAAMTAFVVLVGPALQALQGANRALPLQAALEGGWRKPAGCAHALLCRVSISEQGLRARPTERQGSHILSSMLAANALALVPSEITELSDGASIEIEPLARWTEYPH